MNYKIIFLILLLSMSSFTTYFLIQKVQAAGCRCGGMCWKTIAPGYDSCDNWYYVGCEGGLGYPTVSDYADSCVIRPKYTGQCTAESAGTVDSWQKGTSIGQLRSCPTGGNAGDECAIWYQYFDWGCKCEKWIGSWTNENQCVECWGKAKYLLLADTGTIYGKPQQSFLCTDVGTRYTCDHYNNDQDKCEKIGCSYNWDYNQGKYTCQGTSHDCTWYRTISDCQDTAGCKYKILCEKGCGADDICDNQEPGYSTSNGDTCYWCKIGDGPLYDQCGLGQDSNKPICKESYCEDKKFYSLKTTGTVQCKVGGWVSDCYDVTNVDCCNDGDCQFNEKCSQDHKCAVVCEKLNGTYFDSTTSPQQCDRYEYKKFSSSFESIQYRNYSEKKTGSTTTCNCSVTLDAWINETSGISIKNENWNVGEIQIPLNKNITVYVDILNTGRDQTQWEAGVWFYDNPSLPEGQTGVVKTSVSKDSSDNCQVVSDNLVNGVFKYNEHMKIRCSIEASNFAIGSKVYIYAYERSKPYAELTRVWPSDKIWAIIGGPSEIGDITQLFPAEGVKQGSVVSVSWKLNYAPAAGTDWHTDVHCYLPSDASKVNSYPDSYWGYDYCDPAGGYPSGAPNDKTKHCMSTTDMTIPQDTYQASLVVDQAGTSPWNFYTCRIHLMAENKNVYDDPFIIKVVPMPSRPYCQFLNDRNIVLVKYERMGGVTLNLNVNVSTPSMSNPIKIYDPSGDPESIKICCMYCPTNSDINYTDVPTSPYPKQATRTCTYPEVDSNETFFAQAYFEYLGTDQKNNASYCVLPVNILPTSPCMFNSFTLNGSSSGSSTVPKGESISINVTGINCRSRTVSIKDSAGIEKCTCTFGENQDFCFKSNCFTAPNEIGEYVYNVTHKSSSYQSMINVFNYGLNIISQTYTNMQASWYLYPEKPSRADRMFLVLDAKDLNGNPLAPETGFAPFYRIGGSGDVYNFQFYPELQVGAKNIWVAEITSFDDFYIYPEDIATYPARKMYVNAKINLGQIFLGKDRNTGLQGDQLYIGVTPSGASGTFQISYKLRSSSDFSLLNRAGNLEKKDGYYDATIFNAPNSLYAELLAVQTNKIGGKILDFGLTIPNLSLDVNPDNIRFVSPSSKIINISVRLKNTGNVNISGITVTPSASIANITSVSYRFDSLDVDESGNVSIGLVFTETRSGSISIRYSGHTKNIPVELIYQDPASLQVFPPDMIFGSVAGRVIVQSFLIRNAGSLPVDLRSIIVLGLPNLSVDYSSIALQPNTNRTYTLKGTLFTAGQYSGLLEVDTSIGLKYIPIYASILQVQCNKNKKCELGETNSTCPGDCGICDNNQNCDADENILTCPEDCHICNSNTKCEFPETISNCPSDCKICNGNGRCDSGENSITCPNECVSCNNNTICDIGEIHTKCPRDCFCGNGHCDSDEDYRSCGDCDPPNKPLWNNITALNTSLRTLKAQMDSQNLKGKITKEMTDLYNGINYLLQEAEDLYAKGDYGGAQMKLNMASQEYQKLKKMIDDLVSPPFPFPTLIVVVVVIVALGIVLFVLYYFGYLNRIMDKILRREREEDIEYVYK